jgi:hypothetical protein
VVAFAGIRKQIPPAASHLAQKASVHGASMAGPLAALPEAGKNASESRIATKSKPTFFMIVSFCFSSSIERRRLE